MEQTITNLRLTYLGLVERVFITNLPVSVIKAADRFRDFLPSYVSQQSSLLAQ
ncbi:hypothetical protein SAMN05428962_2715 [Paenibacillus sp. BC26]|nr:hypothetical protein SAMN05428962_2715 [Paenibacillus sp. BC26]